MIRCLLFVVIFGSIQLNLFSQYVDSDGVFLKQQVIGELHQYPVDSRKQDSLRDLIVESLGNDIKTHPVLLDVDKKRHIVMRAMTDMVMERGDFIFLSGRYNRKKADTVSMIVSELEMKIHKLNDSLSLLHKQLMGLTLDKNQSRATREKSVSLLAQSNDMGVIRFIFDNHSELNFGVVKPTDAASDLFGRERTGMHALLRNKLFQYNEEKLDNWILLQFIIEYWGRESYSDQVLTHTHSGLGLELTVFNYLKNNYEKPELMYEFIRANVSNPNTPFLNALYSYF